MAANHIIFRRSSWHLHPFRLLCRWPYLPRWHPAPPERTRSVSTRLYPASVVIVADDQVVARHERLSNAGETRYDWQHYIALLQRKPGALRNGAPFADMPEPLQRLRRGLLRNPGGDRVMAQVLAIVLSAGLDAVLVAVELALETMPAGKVSAEHVVNVLGRLPEPARRDNGYRDYAAEHLERLSFICHCRALDMPLADVNRLLGFVVAPLADCSDVDLLVDEQLARVRA